MSDLALEIIAHPPGAPERAQAISEAATRPELFVDLDSRFQGGRASDAAIRSYLITKKFIPQAADTAIRAYRETKALVAEEAGSYSGESQVATDHFEPQMMPQTADSMSARRPTAGPMMGASTSGEREFIRGQLPRDASYRLLVSGEIGALELGKIIKVLTLQKELLADSDNDSEAPSQ